ncbi:MAG: PIN domain-containing protein [Candidatus Sulfotelmatobacter sp.]
MILTQENEYAAVLDSSVLVPMPLCDTLLRLAEEPAMYRPLWSDQILGEVGRVLEQDFGYTAEQSKPRIDAMIQAFPEASKTIPSCLTSSFDGIPDANDRHVLAAAVRGQANAIVTSNLKHFPAEYIQQFDILVQNPDDFLVHQFHLNPPQVLEKLDAQASGIRKSRPAIIQLLRPMVPNFVVLVEKWSST